MRRIFITFTSFMLLLFSAVYAADDKALPPPALNEKTAGQPAAIDDDTPSSVPKPGEIPEVTITPKPDTKVEEFQVNGQVRYIKITPYKSQPYYLLDTDGDGEVDVLQRDVDKAQVNQWLMMEF